MLEGSRMKIGSCSSFPVLLIDTGEIGAHHEGTDKKNKKGPGKEIKNGRHKKR